jgi:hypothetical protein
VQLLNLVTPIFRPRNSPAASAKMLLAGLILCLNAACVTEEQKSQPEIFVAPVAEGVLSAEIRRLDGKVESYMSEPPITVTAYSSERSAGGRHDFYSEGDYWWPNPEDPDGPYVRRDGLTNPDNFIAHREALMRFSDIVATFTSAYLISGKSEYTDRAIEHLRAWFIEPKTRMNPNLLYAQAIKGHNTGRSIGVIDTIHLTEVARSVKVLSGYSKLTTADEKAIKGWFTRYLSWLTAHPFGLKERSHPNNHSVAWAMQAAAFADLVGDQALLAEIREDFKQRFVGEMMAADGSFPAELARTKAYGYSLFVLDTMATVAQIASTDSDNLWRYQTDDGRGMAKAMQFMRPYIRDKSLWPLAPDVLYWDEWPVRHPSLIFAALAYGDKSYISLWQSLQADPGEYEVMRNLPVRHPLLWLPNKLPGAAEVDIEADATTPDVTANDSASAHSQ